MYYDKNVLEQNESFGRSGNQKNNPVHSDTVKTSHTEKSL